MTYPKGAAFGAALYDFLTHPKPKGITNFKYFAII